MKIIEKAFLNSLEKGIQAENVNAAGAAFKAGIESTTEITLVAASPTLRLLRKAGQ